MGETLPPTMPELLPNKWYRIFVDQFFGPPWNDDCDDLFFQSFNCCTLGQDIINYYAAGGDCESHWSFCGMSDIPVSRITSILGPYDNFGDC